MVKKLLSLVLSFPLVVGAGLSALAQQGSPQPAPPLAEISDAQKRKESFEIVWQTVNERFFDPTFGGVNWTQVRERYAPLANKAQDDQEFHRLLQQMIGELRQSHFVIIPKEAIPRLNPRLRSGSASGSDEDADDVAERANDEATTPLDRLGYQVTERMSSGIGIDLRVLAGAAVITRVERGSVAARAGLRPGFIIKSVGGQSLDAVIAQFQGNQTFHAIFRGALPLILLTGFINGERESAVRIVYLDAFNRTHAVRLKREKLNGEMSPAIGNLPAMYTEFEARPLEGGFGYIRFNAFVPGQLKKICAALRSLRDARGLIIDLRGNQGGLLGMIGGLGGLLEQTPVAFGIMHTRTGRTSVVAFPQRGPYAGPIVIMVDGSTQSAAEMFASGMQETGRAVVVGEQSAGNTLPSAIMKLPTGALFQYGFADYETLAGRTLEGHGITPDVSVVLSRRSLLARADPQMAAAFRKIRELARWMGPQGRPRELIADVSVTSLRTAQPTRSAPTKVEIAAEPLPPPPARRPAPAKIAAENLAARSLSGFPSADEILDHYVQAVGGRAALEKLNSRVSRGTVELQSMGLNGTVEIYEQAPRKAALIMNLPGLGTIQRTFDGVGGWLQDPLEGYIEFPPALANRVGDQSDFHRELRFRELNPGLAVIGKEKVGEREAFVLQPRSLGAAGEKSYFDVLTGLLLRKGRVYYDDYREVDGVKLPFKTIDESANGFGVVVRLSEIKHNVVIDPTKFIENPDCFTKPDQNWRDPK